MYKIGIIGKGFVGSAVFNGFKDNKNFESQIRIHDKNKKLSSHSLEETVNESDYIFLSIPTPANFNGSINLDILEGCLSDISLIQKNDCIILIRSTIVPGSTSYFAKKFPKLKIVFNPEFLTEKNANEDFVNQSRVILGGDKDCTQKVKRLYRKRFGSLLPVICTNYETAELIKYMNNCFLATKVSFMNEMKILSNHINVDWEKAVEGFALDERVGDSHLSVPGHDGKLGFGGSCFPKDLQALIYFAEQLNVDLNVLKGTWETNLDIRKERDWENLKGRAIIKSEEKS